MELAGCGEDGQMISIKRNDRQSVSEILLVNKVC